MNEQLSVKKVTLSKKARDGIIHSAKLYCTPTVCQALWDRQTDILLDKFTHILPLRWTQSSDSY